MLQHRQPNWWGAVMHVLYILHKTKLLNAGNIVILCFVGVPQDTFLINVCLREWFAWYWTLFVFSGVVQWVNSLCLLWVIYIVIAGYEKQKGNLRSPHCRLHAIHYTGNKVNKCFSRGKNQRVFCYNYTKDFQIPKIPELKTQKHLAKHFNSV